MASQPTNEDCADMFRVMLHELIEMHPHYQKLRYKFEGLKRHLENNPGGRKSKPDMDLIRHYVNEIDAVFKEFD